MLAAKLRSRGDRMDGVRKNYWTKVGKHSVIVMAACRSRGDMSSDSRWRRETRGRPKSEERGQGPKGLRQLG